jgi:hypothetical protein
MALGSAPLRPLAEDPLEAGADLVEPGVEPPCDTQQGAEPRVDGAALQLADPVELGPDPLGETLLGQAGLPPQLLDCLPESGMVGRAWFGPAAGRHAQGSLPAEEPLC